MAGRYGLEIRAAGAADAAPLAELLAAAGRPLAPRVLAERLEAARGQPGAVLLAGEWGPPSGLIVLSWRSTLAEDHPVARIEHLLVALDDRRRGIGRLLVKPGAQAARSAGCGLLEIAAPDGEPTLAAFCAATGFSPGARDHVRALRKKS